jgi:hypothetical protein
MTIPSNAIPITISSLPPLEAVDALPSDVVPVVHAGQNYKISLGSITGAAGGVPATRRINTGTGLTGGGALSGDLTLALQNIGSGGNLTGSATSVYNIAWDIYGRISTVSQTTIPYPTLAQVTASGSSSASAITLSGLATLSGGVVMTTGQVTSAPVADNDLVRKTDLQAAQAAIAFKPAVQCAATTNVVATAYNKVGTNTWLQDTLVGSGTLVIDDYTVLQGDFVLLTSQAAVTGALLGAANGSYVATSITAGGWTLTRSVIPQNGNLFFVEFGTSNTGTSYINNTPGVITDGTTNITFTRFQIGISAVSSSSTASGLSLTTTSGTTSPAISLAWSAAKVPPANIASGSTANAGWVPTVQADGTLAYNAVSAPTNVLSATNIAGGTAGALPYQTAPTTTTFLALGTSGYILTASSNGPTYTNPTTITVGSATSATTATSATKASNLALGAAGSIPYQSAADTTSYLALGSSGYVLTAGAAAPAYAAASTLTVGSATSSTTATNLAGGAPASIPYQSAAGMTAFIGAGTSGQVLTSAGANIPVWSTPSTSATNLAGGVAGAVPYQSAVATTGFTAAGTSGQVLTSNGTSSPTWTTINAAPTAGVGISVSGQTVNAVGTTINNQTAAYTLVAGDAGKTIVITTGGVTIPANVLAAGNIVSIVNNSGSTQTITQGSGLTLQWDAQSAATTGNRTLGLYSVATVIFISATSAFILGGALT